MPHISIPRIFFWILITTPLLFHFIPSWDVQIGKQLSMANWLLAACLEFNHKHPVGSAKMKMALYLTGFFTFLSVCFLLYLAWIV
ncbi:MAG: hypothetical protein ACK4LB_01075 [Spirosomataceae bacterium]